MGRTTNLPQSSCYCSSSTRRLSNDLPGSSEPRSFCSKAVWSDERKPEGYGQHHSQRHAARGNVTSWAQLCMNIFYLFIFSFLEGRELSVTFTLNWTGTNCSDPLNSSPQSLFPWRFHLIACWTCWKTQKKILGLVFAWHHEHPWGLYSVTTTEDTQTTSQEMMEIKIYCTLARKLQQCQRGNHYNSLKMNK